MKLEPSKIYSFIFTILLLCLGFQETSYTSESPGRPGLPPHWASARKMGVGTSYEAYDLDGKYSPFSRTAPISRVWFTLADGVLTETYFPTIDMAQSQQTELLISDGKTFLEEEKNGIHTIEWLSPKAPIFRVTTQDPQNRYIIIKTFFTHPEKNVVLVQYEIYSHVPHLTFYLCHNPRASNSGLSDSGKITAQAWMAQEENHVQVLKTSLPFVSSTVGFSGLSDGLTQLKKNFSITNFYDSASNGHIRFVGELPTAESLSLTVALGFGFTPQETLELTQKALQEDPEKLKNQYIQEWQSYFNTLLDLTPFSQDQGKEFYASTVLLKTHEDKTFEGAIVASLSIPWGDAFEGSTSNLRLYSTPRGTGGYHLVWPRDLFHIARAFLGIHDIDTAKNCLRFLKKIQYGSQEGRWNFAPRLIPKQGGFPQNTWVDGEPFWQGLQMDEVAFPLILAWHLWQAGELNLEEYWPMIESAAHLIAQHGPWTAQERWEENYGISPSTVAAEIAALICASDLALAKGAQEASQFWAQTADRWSLTPGDNIESWTFTTSGIWGNGKYYLRLDGASHFSPLEPNYLALWDPNDTQKIALANASGIYLEKEIIDGGFLELVRYGVRSATNEFILDSLPELDEKIKVTTPFGPAWYRYLYDGYGEEGRGRLWTFLTAERAQYELALLLKRKANPKIISTTLDHYIRTLENFANEGGLFPEQVWDTGEKMGQGTGSATPLIWTHAEYIKLLRSKADQKPFDLIPIVYQRYKEY